MNKYLFAALLGSLVPAALAACPYPLDATAAQYAQFQPQVRFPAISFQSVEYVTQSTVDSNGGLQIENFLALSDSMADAVLRSADTGLPKGDIPLPTSGIVAFEWALDHFPATTAEGANLYIGAGFFSSNAAQLLTSNLNDGLSVSIQLANTGYGQGAFAFAAAANRNGSVLNWSNSTPQPLALPLPAGYRIGIYLDMNTRQVGYTLNGVDHGYLQNEYGGPFRIPAAVTAIGLGFSGIMQVQDNNALAGAPVGGTLITDASQFTQPFPAGTTGFSCTTGGGNGGGGNGGGGNGGGGNGGGGNGGGGNGLKLPNGKPYRGNANPAGLQRFQPFLLPAHPLGQLLKANR